MDKKTVTTSREQAKIAAQAHSTLGQFGAIVSLIEGNNIYGVGAQRTAERIIDLCRKEMRSQLEIYDEALEHV